jgi:CDP-diglyceride synthetase
VAAGDLQALALAGLYVVGVSLAFLGNRTALHVAMGNVAWFAFLFEEPWVAAAGALALAAMAGLAWWRPPRAYLEVMGGERDAGPLAFFLALALLAGLWAALAFPTWWLVAAYLVMAVADPAGYYAGKAWGKHALWQGKTAEGFLAVLAAAIPVAVAFEAAFAPGAGIAGILGRGLLVALGAALGEALAPRHTDNLLMPLGALGGLALGHALVGA